MWALGLLVGELAIGKLCTDRIHRFPVSCKDDLLAKIVSEVAGALGDSSQLFLMFSCLLHKDPALRLTARQLQLWLDSGAAPADVVPNQQLVQGCSGAAAAGGAAANTQLPALFSKHRMEKFASALADEGFECVEDFADASEFDDAFLASLGMRKGHIKRFRIMLAELAAAL
jgi:hypothetical protein